MLQPYTDLLTGEEVSVDEILVSYGIKGLSLSELQEKYVNDSDADWQRYSDLEEKYEELNGNFSDLSDEIYELRTTIEELETTVNSEKNIDVINNNSSLVIVIIALIIAIVYITMHKKEI